MALLEVVREAVNRGWTNIVFESDSKIVVDAIHAKQSCASKFSAIISSINMLLNFSSNFKVKFIKRQANVAAHILTRATNSWFSLTVFDDTISC
jgi:ribonuclease HI